MKNSTNLKRWRKAKLYHYQLCGLDGDVQNIASLGRVITVSNGTLQKKKTFSLFDWFGHLLDSIHPKIHRWQLLLLGQRSTLKLIGSTLPKSMVGWNFLRRKKHIWTGANLLLASGMVISSRCCQNVWLPILHACWGILDARSETRLHDRTFKIGKSIGLMKKKPGKIDRSTEMRWEGRGRASTLGSRKKNIHKKNCRNWFDPTCYYVSARDIKSYQKELIWPSSCSNKNSSTKTVFQILYNGSKY